jgi:hypothetical protein
VQATRDAGKDWKLNFMKDCTNFKTLAPTGVNDETACVYPLKPTKNTYTTGTRTYVGIQCTTCHDAHNDQYKMFMRERVSFDNFSCANYGTGGFCLHCHDAKPTVDLYKSTYRTGNYIGLMNKKYENNVRLFIKTGLFLCPAFMFILFVCDAFAFTEQEFLLLLAKTPTHKIISNNPNGCKTCHGGVGYSAKQEEEVCYLCHGVRSKSSKRLKKAKLKPLVATNVRKDFEKPYHHPVERNGLHNAKEKFPVIDPNIPRHSECLDCHDTHYSIPEIPLLAVSGIDIAGKSTRYNLAEYEVCFKCHGADTNKPAYQKNKVREFDPKNPSFHPVVDIGKNNYLPSLERGLKVDTLIQCSSCHGSDEKGQKECGACMDRLMNISSFCLTQDQKKLQNPNLIFATNVIEARAFSVIRVSRIISSISKA